MSRCISRSFVSALALLVACFSLTFVGSTGGQLSPSHAFASGERLVYSVTYLGVRGGTVVMEVADTEGRDGRPAYKCFFRWMIGSCLSWMPRP